MELLFVRNAETPLNNSGVIQGITDPDLTDDGEGQAEAAGEILSQLAPEIDAVYSSDLTRARRTANLACPDQYIHEDERLREQDFGDATGQKLSEFIKDNPEYNINRQNAMARTFPNGESTLDLCQRVLKAVRDIVRSHEADDTVVIFSHQVPILCFLAFVQDEGLHETINTRRDVDFGEVLHFGYNGHEFTLRQRRSPL